MSKSDPKLPPDTEEAKALAEVSAQRFNRYQSTFVPLENQYMGDVMHTRNESVYDNVGGMASAQYADQFGKANNQLSDEMTQQGVDPTSGVFVGQSSALRKAQAVRQGEGVATAKVNNTDRFYDGLSGLVAMGQGQAGDAIGGLGDLATKSSDKAMADAQTSFQMASGMRAGVGTMVGLGVSPYVDKMTQNAVKTPTSVAPKVGG